MKSKILNIPAGLVRSSETGSIISMEELVEPNIVPEVWIPIQLSGAPVRSSSAIHIFCENMDDSVLNFLGNLVQRHEVSTIGWALDF